MNQQTSVTDGEVTPMNGPRVVEMTGDAAFAVNAEGKITAWNEAAEQSLGYLCSEVVDRHCWNVVCGRDLSCNRGCGRSCPFIELQGEPILPAQSLFGLLDRTDMLLRDVSGETTRVNMSTVLVAAAGSREIVHLLKSKLWLKPSAAPVQRPAGAGALPVRA